METLASSNQNSPSHLICSARGVAVQATPEELVRQRLLYHLREKLGFPKSLISLERMVAPLRRRFDVVIFYQTAEQLKPLLLIECKAKKGGQAAMRQLLGYNALIQAPFIGLGDADGFRCYTAAGEEVPIPTYQALLQAI